MIKKRLKKQQITKLDITRWLLVLPISVLALFVYVEFSSWLNKVYLINFKGNGDSYFTAYINCFFIPTIILLTGYFISPKFRFRSTLILVIFFVAMTGYAINNNVYIQNRFNPFIALYFVTILLGLCFIYKLEKK